MLTGPHQALHGAHAIEQTLDAIKSSLPDPALTNHHEVDSPLKEQYGLPLWIDLDPSVRF